MLRAACFFSLAVFLMTAPRSRGDDAELPARPNVIVVLTDDQGYGDLGCNGNPVIKTPNIDRFAAESVRLTNFHASPTCAPSRSVLMSGRHEFHNGVTHTINERERMSLKTVTLPQVLQSAGYTTGIFGKWHLGDEDAYQPERRGFDEVFIHGAGGIGQTYVGSCGDAPGNRYFDPAVLHNGRFEKTKGYCTDVFFDQATRWIEKQKDAAGPFFAYIATNAPHAPLDCPESYVKMYEGKVPEKAARFYGMITNIDENFGKLMAKIKEWKLDEKTLVVFMTDNGGTAGVPVFNAGMRGSKVMPYEGGIRVPSIWRWSGVFRPGVVDRLTAHLDVFPTLAELAGATITPEVADQIDGRSLVPLLRGGNAPWPDRELFTHVGRWERGQAGASKYRNASVRTNRYQMVTAARDGSKHWELYDLWNDPGEQVNVASRFPDVVRQLDRAYDRWWESVLPDLVNEDVVGPAVNPFKERYWKQFPDERPAASDK